MSVFVILLLFLARHHLPVTAVQEKDRPNKSSRSAEKRPMLGKTASFLH
jgi:hypothetical protein